MPMENIIQPAVIPIDETLRLRAYDGVCDFALDWYQDIETVKLIDGVEEPYDREKLHRMYDYLNAHGELYFIEVLEGEQFLPVGDVTLWQEDLPIVISRPYQNKGIGKRVIAALIRRSRELGWKELNVEMIYHYNNGSRRLFEGADFVACAENEKGRSYKLIL